MHASNLVTITPIPSQHEAQQDLWHDQGQSLWDPKHMPVPTRPPRAVTTPESETVAPTGGPTRISRSRHSLKVNAHRMKKKHVRAHSSAQQPNLKTAVPIP